MKVIANVARGWHTAGFCDLGPRHDRAMLQGTDRLLDSCVRAEKVKTAALGVISTPQRYSVNAVCVLSSQNEGYRTETPKR